MIKKKHNHYSSKDFRKKNQDLVKATLIELKQKLKYLWTAVKNAKSVKQPNGTISYVGKKKALRRIKQISYEISLRNEAEKKLNQLVGGSKK